MGKNLTDGPDSSCNATHETVRMLEDGDELGAIR